jgi:hypothetical protein
MSDGGKGDTRRPTLIEKKEFEDKWNNIFGEKPILTGYCDVCNRKYSWCSCGPVPKELEKQIDKALGIERKNESLSK